MFKRLLVLLFSIVFILSGCQTPEVYHQTTDNIAQVQSAIDAGIKKSDNANPKAPPLMVNQGLYVDKTPINLIKRPSWLKKNIIIKGDNLPFSYYTRTVVGSTGRTILLHYQTGLKSDLLMSMNYAGTLKGALDVIAAKTGFVYTISGNNVYWQEFVTKTFDIGFMPGAADYMMGKTGGSSGGQSAGGQVTGILDDSAASQFSNLKGTLSIWKDLAVAIKALLSPDGKVVVSEAATSVTVTDRPSNIALVSNYICNLNKNMAKQVLVKVEVLEVQLASDFNYGINWSIVEHSFGNSNFAINSNYGTPVAITGLNGAAINTAGLIGQNPPGTVPTASSASGITLLINALKQQGRVSVVTQPRVVCLNNQVSAIRLVTQNGYLASVQNTSFGGGSTTGNNTGNSVTSQITPGILVTGLTLYVLPKIIGHKVFMQVNADLSNNVGFKTIAAGGTNGTTIEFPNVTQKQFNQRAVIGSGDTLILAGFKQLNNQTGAGQVFDQQILGGRGSIQSNNETIILITPIILAGAI